MRHAPRRGRNHSLTARSRIAPARRAARGEAGPASDVDLFFDYEKGSFSLFDLMDVQERTSDILGRKADVMTRDSIHKMLRSGIETSALKVF
jgi:uncharacterized protein